MALQVLAGRAILMYWSEFTPREQVPGGYSVSGAEGILGGKLRPSLHYRLVLLSRERRFYAETFKDIRQLKRMGLAEMTGATSDNGSQEWTITDAGQIALQDHDKGKP